MGKMKKIIIYYLINRRANLFAETRKSSKCEKFGKTKLEMDGFRRTNGMKKENARP